MTSEVMKSFLNIKLFRHRLRFTSEALEMEN